MNEQPSVGKHKAMSCKTLIHLLGVSCGICLLASFSLLFSAPLHGDSNYYRHVFFDNSLAANHYFYSQGHVSPPSKLALENGKLPVETTVFYTPPNALRLEWLSNPSGGWEATVRLVNFRDRHPAFLGDTLFFWLYSAQPISAADLPFLWVSDAQENFSASLALGKFTSDIPAKKWVQIKIPLNQFLSYSIHALDAHQLESITLSQSFADGKAHTLILDEIKIDYDSATEAPRAQAAPPAPRGVAARGYDRHIDVSWEAVSSDALERYVIYRSSDGNDFRPVGIQEAGVTRYVDFLGKSGERAYYKVAASDRWYRESELSAVASSSTHELNDDDLLTMLQEACFRYYWEGAHPDAGMALESIPGDDRIVATGASGFGIMAVITGVDRSFITREQGLQRLTKIVNFLERAPRYHGAWSHFMNGTTAESMPVFGMFDDGGDLVETAFLIEGLLAARQYFHGSTQAEQSLYARITHL